jgi:hypothetical protein
MKKIFIYSLILVVLLGVGQRAGAAGPSYVLLEPLPHISGVAQPTNCVDSKGQPIKDKYGNPVTNTGDLIRCIDVNTFIAYVFKFAIAIAVFLATVMIIWGGFEYMLSESITSHGDAISKFENAGFGLAIALCSYLILQTIDPRLVLVQTTIPEVKVNTTDAQNFQTAVAGDISKLSADTRTTVSNNDKQATDLQKQIRQLQETMLDPAQNNYDNQVKLSELQMKYNDIQSTNSQLIANGSMTGYFKNAIDYIQNGGGNSDTISNSIDSINAVYQKNIQDPAIANDPKASSNLTFQRDYRIEQIQEEQDLAKQLYDYKDEANNKSKGFISETYYQQLQKSVDTDKLVYNYELSYLNGTHAQITPDLQDKINLQTLNDLKKVKADPILSQEYAAVLKARVDKIDSTYKQVNSILGK